MATVMLIPALDPVPGTDLFTGVVLERIPAQRIEDRVIWRSPVARVSKLDAETDAIEAVDRIAYERRHQLYLPLL